jgi:DNA-directed RNA polymerase subunit RPC12/RpoP
MLRPAEYLRSPHDGLVAGTGHDDAGGLMADANGRAEGVLVQVCIQCGKEYTFEDEQPVPDMTCEKCGGNVFRSFYSEAAGDEAAQDFRETTERDTLTTDPSTDISQGDLHDLRDM